MMTTILISKTLLFLFFMSLTYIIYFIIRFVHLISMIKNDEILKNNIVDMRENLFNKDKLIILWISISFLLFFIFI
jgi:hypothetical protein